VNGFVGVEDVARITEWMLNSKIDQERFIVNAENWSFEALLNTIAKSMHKKSPSRKATAGMSEFAWRWEAFKSWFSKEPPLLTRESARVAQSKTYFDNQKIIQAIPGFSFTPIKQVIEESATLYLRRAHN
jgi:nucleoside-diphosphate-sugar epimerase